MSPARRYSASTERAAILRSGSLLPKHALLDPEFFKPYEDRGMSIRIDEGKIQTLPGPLGAIRM